MERAKTPISMRAPSRQSNELPARSASRASRVFDVGDHVRIESLGFEGILRFIGEIDGKPGLWAGVELLPGFAGKGKNNGSVGGCVPYLNHLRTRFDLSLQKEIFFLP
jgi:CAP-Gly domain-containing linker protein 1